MMPKEKKRHKNVAIKVWAVVSILVLLIGIVLNQLATNRDSRYYLGSFFDVFFGGQRPIYDSSVVSMYPAQKAKTKDEALLNAQNMNVRLAQEGFVLLKNESSALPLRQGAKISVFGKNSVNLSYGGSGSGGFDTSNHRDLYDALSEAGFQTNPTLKAFYENSSQSGAARAANSSDLDSGGNQVIATAETPQSRYTNDVKNSYRNYADAALVVITRIGGEGFDLPRYQGNTEGAVSPDSHYLELDRNELDLLSAVCDAGFEHVIVLFNIPSSFEAAFLNDPAYASRIDAAIWIGFTGSNGILALGDILNGSVNPSGHLVDTWAADFTANPAFQNFGTGVGPDHTDKYDGGMYYSVDYEEGIYVGYRYYETRGLTDGEAWYRENVVFPFGYGLSYTTFDWEVSGPDITEITPDGVTSVDVTVKNTGSVAGKDVVQLYATAPYTEGGIEKAYKVLVSYGKTRLLNPGESETLTLTFDPYTAASYDYRDANGNGFCGYELEAGDYILHVAKNAHETVQEIVLTLEENIQYGEDPVTGEEVVNRYTGLTDILDSDWQLSDQLSRADWEGTWPTPQGDQEHAGDARLYEEIRNIEHNNPTDFEEEEYLPWLGSEVVTRLRDLLPEERTENGYHAIVDYDDDRWEEITDACTEEEIMALLNNAAYHTLPIESIGLPATLHGDGPSGFTCFLNRDQVNGTCQYVSEPVMASTWNDELIEEMGEALGEEGILGDRTTGQPYTSIYAPGVNIHRLPFGGRCSEYFSEDPFISGMMAAAEIRGLQSRGVLPMVKHFAANEQETHRSIGGDLSWVTEQALREIYLKSFEYAVKRGESRGVMTSFNRIGTRWTGGDYRLVTEILRNEWGFRGAVICDFNTIPQYMIPKQMYYAGGDLDLATLNSAMWTDADSSDTADAVVMARAAKNVMYALVNSNAMNAEVIGYEPPVWHTYLRYLNMAGIALIVLWGIWAIAHSIRKKSR
ncbi:MAG: glycoside hydrolase family 3 C-terminal domain-containing protein [Clostridia bacterium]|nr:glycoside hydrolase family 3 C-terminal domain-containing protein [Clostridia bacterium]